MVNNTNKGDCNGCSAFQVFPTNTFSSSFACLSEFSVVEVDFFQGSKLKERENARALHMNMEACRKIVQPDDMTVRHLRRPRMKTKIMSEIIWTHGSRLKFK